jgi:hypothetical protein
MYAYLHVHCTVHRCIYLSIFEWQHLYTHKWQLTRMRIGISHAHVSKMRRQYQPMTLDLSTQRLLKHLHEVMVVIISPETKEREKGRVSVG